MELRWYTLVVDCNDVAAQARWWAQALDWQIVYEAPDEVVVIPPRTWAWIPCPPRNGMPSVRVWCSGLVFGQVPEAKAVKNRLHIDLAPHTSQDRDAEIEALLAAGATRVDVGQDDDEVTWTVLADPEGNEFCVLSARQR